MTQVESIHKVKFQHNVGGWYLVEVEPITMYNCFNTIITLKPNWCGDSKPDVPLATLPHATLATRRQRVLTTAIDLTQPFFFATAIKHAPRRSGLTDKKILPWRTRSVKEARAETNEDWCSWGGLTPNMSFKCWGLKVHMKLIVMCFRCASKVNRIGCTSITFAWYNR